MTTTHSRKTDKRGADKAQAQRSATAKPPESAGRGEQAQRLSGAYSMGPAVAMRAPVQTKLTVGRAGDSYEREADQVAERVATGQPTGDVSRIPPGGLQSQRAADDGTDNAADGARDEKAGAAQPKCAACGATQAQRQQGSRDDNAADDTAQAKCAACEAKQKAAQRQEADAESEVQERTQRAEDDEGIQQRAQREEDEGPVQEKAQRAEDSGGEKTEVQAPASENKEAQAKDEGDGASEETAQAKCEACEHEAQGGAGGAVAQRAPEAADAGASEAREDVPAQREEEAGAETEGAEGGGDAQSRGAECGPGEAEAAAGGGAESAGAESEEAEEGGRESEAGEGEGAAEGAEGERESAAPEGGTGGDLTCGEESGESDEAGAAGGQSCGGSAEAAAESEGAAGGAAPATEGGQPAGEERPAEPPAGGAVPRCGEAVEAASEKEGEEEGQEGSQGGGESGGACATAQRKETAPPRKKDRGLDTRAASTMIRARGAGEPMAPAVRQRIEGSLGVDLRGVRVHADGNAQSAARALRAKAFTTGNHIFLGAGQSQHDTNLMAHESTHVLQQDAVARRKPAQGEEAAATASSPAARATPVSPVAAPGVAAKVDTPAGGAPAVPSTESTPGSAAAPPGGAQPPAPPVPPKDAAAAPTRATAAAGHVPKAAALPARPPAAAASASSAVSAPDVATARVVSRSIAPPDPSAFTGEPSDSVAALASLSPVRAPFAFRMFSEGVDGSLTRRRASEHRDVPHGRYQVRSPNLPDGRPEQPSVAPGATPTAGAFAPAPIPTPAKVTVASENAGPAPSVDITSHEREVEAVDEKKPGALDLLHDWMRRFFASVPTSDSNVNTDPGPVPTITYTKDSDPAQIQSIEAEHEAKVAHGLEEADEERDDDFGEHEIEPDLEDGEEKIPVPAHVHKMGTGCDPEAEAEPLAFDAPHEAELAERVHAETGSRWTAETDRLDASEGERDRKIAGERAALPGRIAAAHTEAYRQEDEAAAAARTEVNRLRQTWGAENRGVQMRFEGEAGKQSEAQRIEIAGHVAKEEGLIGERHKTDKAAAEAEKKRVEENARKEKEEAERKAKSEKSGGLLSRGVNWVKNKAKSALAWVAKKVKGWFDDLRAWVRKKFDEFKQWVNDKIEAARRWINEKLEGLRRRFHALVDKYLGEYPEIAARFHRAIDSGIDAAQAAVNRAADRLKKAVNKLIDGLAKAVDVALAVVEKVVVGALTVACDIVVTASNLVVAFVEGDLESMITLVKELPDWPPLFGGLMSVVRAGFLGFLEKMARRRPDEKKRFVEKLRGLLTSGKYYGGVFLGILNGLVVEGLFGTIKMIYDIITSIPDIITGIYDAIKKLASDVEAIAAIADRFRATKAEIQAFLARPESAQEMIAMLKRSPEILVAMVDKALHEGREWAYRAGAKAADALYGWVVNSSNFQIGLAVGTFIGRVIFEVLLLVFTAGAGTAIKWGGKALQLLLKGMRMLTNAARGGGGFVLRGINLLREIVFAGLTAARRLGGTIKKVLAKIGDLVDSVFDWFRRAFGRVRPKLKAPAGPKKRRLDPQEEARWQAFRAEVGVLVMRHRDSGVKRPPLERDYRAIVNRFKPVASKALITADAGFWELWAKKAGSLAPRKVARVAMDHASRWEEAKQAVRQRLLRVRDDEREESRLTTILEPLKRKWRFSALDVHDDSEELDFDVMGAMSKKRKIAEVPARLATKSNPLPLQYPKRASSGYPPLYIGPNVGAGGPIIRQDALEKAQSDTAKKQTIAARLPAGQRKKWKAEGMPIEIYRPHGSRALPFGSKTALGILPGYRIRTGVKLKLSPGDGTPGGGRINRPLRLFGFSPAREKMDGDHVVEIQLGGEDLIDNLWPLDYEENQLAGSKLASMKFATTRGKSVQMSKLKKLARRGRAIWFKITRTK